MLFILSRTGVGSKKFRDGWLFHPSPVFQNKYLNANCPCPATLTESCACSSLRGLRRFPGGDMRSLILLCVAILLAGAPAFAQIDFSGEWTPNGNEDSIGNPYVGDWLGIPMSDASRAR